MKESTYYHTAFEQTLLNETIMRHRINTQINAAPVPERKHIRISRRVAIALALAFMLLTVASAAAATAWHARKNYTPSEYLNQGTAEERQSSGESISDVENAIKAARPSDVSYSIRMLPEIDTDGTIAQWRAAMEQPPYDDADWAWVRTLRPSIGDVLYDGKSVYVTTTVYTDRPDTFRWWSDDDREQSLWIACEEAEYTVEGDETVYWMPLTGEQRFEGISRNSLIVDAQADISHSTQKLPEQGTVTMTEHLYVVDGKCENMQPTRGAIAIIDFTFTFDAASLRPAAKTAHVSIPLSGTHIVTMQERYNPARNPDIDEINKSLSLDGVKLDAAIEYRPIGIYVTITVQTAPESWTDYEKISLLNAIEDNMYLSGEPISRYRVNREEELTPERLNYGADDMINLLLPIYPSEYSTISSLTLDLSIRHITAVNGENPRDDWSVSYRVTNAFASYTFATEPLLSVEIPVPKR